MWNAFRHSLRSLLEHGRTPIAIGKAGSSVSLSSLAGLQLLTAFAGSSKDESPTSAVTMTKPLEGNSASGVFVFGEDSLFVHSTPSQKQPQRDFMGVADGVGGWRELGIDPSIFSSNLMRQCRRIIRQEEVAAAATTTASSRSSLLTRPIEILAESYQSLLESKERDQLVGSSTACLLVFDRDTRVLHAANLGDSGFVVIRDNRVVYRSTEQYHYFNAPYQLAILPASQGGDNTDMLSDKPKHAAYSTFQLVEDDLLVLATDGLWDNMSERTLLQNTAMLKVSNLAYIFSIIVICRRMLL